MAQQTKSKSSASSGSRSNRRKSPAKGRTTAKSRSGASRSKNPRTSPRKTRPRAPGANQGKFVEEQGPRRSSEGCDNQGREHRRSGRRTDRQKAQDSGDRRRNGARGTRCGYCPHSQQEQEGARSPDAKSSRYWANPESRRRGEEHWRARRADRESGRTGARRKRGDRRGQRAPQVQVRDRGRPGGPYESFAIKGRLIGRCNSALVSSATTGAAVEVRPSPRSSGRSERRSAAPRQR